MSLKALQTEHLACKCLLSTGWGDWSASCLNVSARQRPPQKMYLCAAMATAGVLAEADVIVNLLLMRREANGVMKRKQERRRHLCPTGNKTSCAHTAAGQTLMNSFTHSFAYTLSHKTPACFPFVSPNQHSSFFLYLPSHLCSAIYFCLYSVSSSIITGTIGDSNHCTLEIDPEWKNYHFIFLTYCI